MISFTLPPLLIHFGTRTFSISFDKNVKFETGRNFFNISLSRQGFLVGVLQQKLRNSETQKFIQHNTRVKNVQQCYCIKIVKYFNYVIFMYYVMEIEQRLFNR